MERGAALPTTAELIARIDWLIRLRWVAGTGVLVIVTVATRLLGVPLAAQWLYLVALSLITYNAIFYVVARRLRKMPPAAVTPFASAFANVQISVDFFALASLLHFSGGLENPFTCYFIFHVIISSILLSRRATYFQATCGLLLLAGMGMGEYAGLLQEYHLWPGRAIRLARDPIFVAAQLSAIGTMLYLSAYMATGIVTRLRTREQEIVDLSQEIRRNAEALERAYDRLSETEKMKSQYMRKVSHELRSPLATIQSTLKVVLDGLVEGLSGRSRDMVARAERRARELIDVTQDLLILSRARDAKLPEQMERVSIADVTASICDELRPTAEEKGIELALDAAQGIPRMLADPEGVKQLVGNLVGNAIRYTPAGGSVKVSLAREGGGVRLEVADTGIGIPKEDLPKIFEEFYRSENARQHASDGTGLGLSIVKAIAEAHGAAVTVDSEVGRGTRFAVVFPQRGG